MAVSQTGQQPPFHPTCDGRNLNHGHPWELEPGTRLCVSVLGQSPAVFSDSTRTPGSAITEIPVIFIMLQAGILSDRLGHSCASLSHGNVSFSSLQTLVCSILLLLPRHPQPCLLMLLPGDHPVTGSLEGSDD